MKTAYIAHPISSDVKGNLEKVAQIAREINLNEPDVIPFAPYFLDCHALNDDNPEERKRGIKNDNYFLENGFVDELRLYGDKISKGMQEEINIALRENIAIVPMNEKLYEDFHYKKHY
jgi:hypothetical protein